jgi:hypothetical protein
MSSIFSDPFFRRGATLLGGETIEYSDAPTNSKPIAGTEIVGQVKVFQDVEPTGTQKRLSNRLVYCVAARYKGTTVTDASTVAGTLYAFDTGSDNAALTEFTSAASATNIANGRAYGVLDEYLGKVELRQNDIVWLVVKGPVKVKKTGGVSGTGTFAAGSAAVVSATDGSITYKADTTASVGTVMIGQHLGSSAAVPAADSTIRINLWSDEI